MTDHDLELWVRRADDLRVFPPIAREALEVARDPTASFRHLERVIGRDAALALRVLRLANSPLYGLPRPVGTLRDALVVLGLREAVSLVLAVAMGASGVHDDRTQQLWHHAMRTASLTRLLVVRSASFLAGPAFLAGCVHDVGMRVFLESEPDAYGAILDRWGAHGPGLIAAERDAFGVDHATLGGACFAAWRFDPRLVEAIANHHRPCTPESTHLAAAVRLADRIDGAVERGLHPEEAVHRASRTPAAAVLGLDAIDLAAAAAGLSARAAVAG